MLIKHCKLLLSFQLIGGLADEKGRWQDSVNRLEKVLRSIVGDVLVSAGYVAYLGPFTVSMMYNLGYMVRKVTYARFSEQT